MPGFLFSLAAKLSECFAKTMKNSPTLLLIDVQKALAGDDPYYGGARNNPEAEENMARLLAHWRAQDWPRIFVRHASADPASPLHPSKPGYAWQDAVAPRTDEREWVKSVNSCFIGTTVEAYLREQGVSALVIVGLTTDHCVSTTTRMAGNLGFEVTLVGDATASYDRIGPDGASLTAEEMHRVNLASLHGEFCTVRTAAAVLED